MCFSQLPLCPTSHRSVLYTASMFLFSRGASNIDPSIAVTSDCWRSRWTGADCIRVPCHWIRCQDLIAHNTSFRVFYFFSYFFFHRLINHTIIKSNVRMAEERRGERGSIFKNNRTSSWTGAEQHLQTMALAHLFCTPVNQWALSKHSAGYLCCCRFDSQLPVMGREDIFTTIELRRSWSRLWNEPDFL